MRNTKADALAPRQPDQAVRIEYQPTWPHEDGTYDTISFHPDDISAPAFGQDGGRPMKDVIRDLLAFDHLTIEEIVERSGMRASSVKTTLYQAQISGNRLFGRLPSGKWEILPISNGITGSVTDPS